MSKLLVLNKQSQQYILLYPVNHNRTVLQDILKQSFHVVSVLMLVLLTWELTTPSVIQLRQTWQRHVPHVVTKQHPIDWRG